MFSRRLPSFSIRRHRRALAAGALAIYVLSVVGFPLPMPSVAHRDTSTPFPCQHHNCGCQSADQCWRSCCCYSPEERLAWAQAHHVAIPADARAALVRESHEDHAHESCCRSSADEHDSDGHRCPHCREEKNAPPSRWAFGFQAQKCQGLTLLWLATGVTLPLENPAAWEFEWREVGRVCAADAGFSPLVSEPPVPPPRA